MSVTIFRHAQSMANAGHATDEPSGIPLSPLGIQQAELLSRRFERSPTLIVTSPFTRTGETAAPIRRRFPDVPHKKLPIQEFTYLSAEPLRGTTISDRSEFAKAFWDKADPHRREPGAESLADFFQRAMGLLDWLEWIDGDEVKEDIVIISHGIFMRALMWCLLTNSYSVSPDIMRSFRSFCFSLPIPNTVAMPLTQIDSRWYVGSLSISHLPTDMVTT